MNDLVFNFKARRGFEGSPFPSFFPFGDVSSSAEESLRFFLLLLPVSVSVSFEEPSSDLLRLDAIARRKIFSFSDNRGRPRFFGAELDASGPATAGGVSLSFPALLFSRLP
jgi:hypothetical protein